MGGCAVLMLTTSGQSVKVTNDTLSWRHYFDSVFRLVLLKSLIDLSIGVIIVVIFYSLAFALTYLAPEPLVPLLVDAKAAAVTVALVYLVSFTLAAGIRLYHVILSDIRRLHSAGRAPSETESKKPADASDV